MPASDNVERMHHLDQLNGVVRDVSAITDRSSRVAEMRRRYATAASDFDDIMQNVPGILRQNDKRAWCEDPDALVETYATAEGL
ncbi:hypothetical protein MhomT_16190 [Microbacterium hominis]|nr:hypothetical protein MhomT_16190 [Microbacterium hominis]